MKLRKADLGLIVAVIVLVGLGIAAGQRDHAGAGAERGAAPVAHGTGH